MWTLSFSNWRYMEEKVLRYLLPLFFFLRNFRSSVWTGVSFSLLPSNSDELLTHPWLWVRGTISKRTCYRQSVPMGSRRKNKRNSTTSNTTDSGGKKILLCPFKLSTGNSRDKLSIYNLVLNFCKFWCSIVIKYKPCTPTSGRCWNTNRGFA